jgi:2-phosphoglycerate kinase
MDTPQRSERRPEGRARHVTVRDGKAGLPYSKGLMATSVMAAGLPPSQAYHVAEILEQRLHADARIEVTTAELRELAAGVLADEVGPRWADNYRSWQRAQDRDVPLIVLIGGTTGVGKSTVATTVASRLGIVRIVSTDAVREVMRGIFTPEMMPSLHTSSFDVTRLLPDPPGEVDPVIAGFRQQVQAVSVGVAQLLRRAVVEGTDLVVEGAHLVPGAVRLPAADRAIVTSAIITVDDEPTHRSHFEARASEARGRRVVDEGEKPPASRYLERLPDIRTIQDYLRMLGREHGVPVVSSYGLDATVARIMELVVAATTSRQPSQPERRPSGAGRT